MNPKSQFSKEEDFPFDSITEFIDFFTGKGWTEFKFFRPLLQVSKSSRFAKSVWKRWLNEEKRRKEQEKRKEAHQRKTEEYIKKSIDGTRDIPADPRPDWKYKWK